MKIAIRYFSKTGNTKKLAEAIAQSVGVVAQSIEVPIVEKVDVLFLGSSVYGGTVDPQIRSFLLNLKKEQAELLVYFGTAALLSSSYKSVRRICRKQNLNLSEREFHCRGASGKLHKGRPNKDDIQKVAEFAKSFLTEKH
ncbi:flavodoxin family protein [uncultured Sphaerochaeta sp.]|uniref:flavodoxin family protein n=1 Tax=uncultured Sphaerochaeta sp. TaxID=886478 RepID=UPI002A0A7C36|nr:flavodoxin family protein [uncultured Sphaerochaeta sp.]